MTDSPLVTATELRDAPPAVLLDVRWALGDPNGREHYLDGHIPGAIFVDLDTELAAPPAPARGRHPLPQLSDLQNAARRWGIRAGDRVVVYDDTSGMAAARAWWLLRWGGLEDVRILDGGLAAWHTIDAPMNRGPEPDPEPGNVTLSGGGMPVIDIDEAARWPEQGVLLDARSAERYRGETEPVDPRAGHIPGARTAPTTENLSADGRFRPPDEIAQRFAGLVGSAPVAVYCGSGVTAAHEIAALAAAGIDAALYPGSWSQWSNDSSRPVAMG